MSTTWAPANGPFDIAGLEIGRLRWKFHDPSRFQLYGDLAWLCSPIEKPPKVLALAFEASAVRIMQAKAAEQHAPPNSEAFT